MASSSAPSSHCSPTGVGSSGEPGSSRKRPRSPSFDPPVGGTNKPLSTATCNKAVPDYLGIAPGVATDCLLKVMTSDGGDPKTNKWQVVVAACHSLLELDCGVKAALDADDDKCFVLCRNASHAEPDGT